MDYYLASKGLGASPTQLKRMAPRNKKLAFIQNAMDYSDDEKYKQKKLRKSFKGLNALGFETEQVDLRKYFRKKGLLKKKLSEYGTIFVSGGNTFVLREAMKLSGFDEWLKINSKRKNLLYCGASAGICVLAPSLHGVDIADDPKDNPYKTKVIWEGLDLIPYLPLPHYKTPRKWGRIINRCLNYCLKHRIVFRVLKNNETIIIKDGKEKLIVAKNNK